MRRALPVLLTTAALGLTACGSGDDPAASGQPAIDVKAGDSSCQVSRTELDAGTHTFAISNVGDKTTEVYLYAEGDRIVAEKENIAPGLSYELTAQVTPGSYVVACKPGQAGDGIRTPVTVAAGAAGAAAAAADPASDAAVATYRAYVQQQADALVPLVEQFAAAVRSGDVAAARALYAPSREPWERVEPVAEAFGDLDPEMDLREADLEPGQEWQGWHRLEKALWVEGSTAGMEAVADGLVGHAEEFRDRVSTAVLTPTSIGNGAKELIDEVATGKITGEEEAFSHTDLYDFAANVEGAQQAFTALRPLVETSDAGLAPRLDPAFAAVRASLEPYRAGAGWVSYDTVDDAGRRELARVVDGLGEPLSQLAAAASA